MSVSVTITNNASTPTNIPELYVTLAATGETGDSITIERSVAQLDSMISLKALVHAETVDVVPTASSDNADLISIPLEQHGTTAAALVSSVAVVEEIITFAEPFPSAPKVYLTMDSTNSGVAQVMPSVTLVTTTGFTVRFKVIVVGAALTTVTANWMAVL